MNFIYLRVFSIPETYLVLKDVRDILKADSRQMRGKHFGVFDVTLSPGYRNEYKELQEFI